MKKKKTIYDFLNNSGNMHKINPTVLKFCKKTQMIELYKKELGLQLKYSMKNAGVISC
jgi:hypothetical protein